MSMEPNTQDNWIRTSERHPDREINKSYSNPKVIVWYKGEVTMLCFNHQHECWDDEDGDDYCCEISDVELWQPCPAAPTKLDKKTNTFNCIKGFDAKSHYCIECEKENECSEN